MVEDGTDRPTTTTLTDEDWAEIAIVKGVASFALQYNDTIPELRLRAADAVERVTDLLLRTHSFSKFMPPEYLTRSEPIFDKEWRRKHDRSDYGVETHQPRSVTAYLVIGLVCGFILGLILARFMV